MADNGTSTCGGAGAQAPGMQDAPVVQTTKAFHAPRAERSRNRLRTLVVLVASVALLAAIVISGVLATDAAMQTDFSAKNLAPSFAHLF